MALDKSRLKKFLNDLPLFDDEKRMWYAVGFYVSPSPTNKYSTTVEHVELTDAMGNTAYLLVGMGNNIRLTVMEWWQGEKTKPHVPQRPQYVEQSLDELENRKA